MGRLDKNEHQRAGEEKYTQTDKEAKGYGTIDCTFDSGTNAFCFLGTKILSSESRKSITKILYWHIGKGIDLYRSGKSSHDRRPKAVDKSLNHKNPQVHHRLLQASERRETGNF